MYPTCITPPKYIQKIYFSYVKKSIEKLISKGVKSKKTANTQSLEKGNLLYIPANSLPYHVSGYTTRTDAILRNIYSEHPNLIVHTRPGYPFDKKERLCDAQNLCTNYSGIDYHHAEHPKKLLLLPFVKRASKVLFEFAKKKKISSIHAASNYVNALPALIAARTLGIPFHYEMRGLWELSRISYEPSFEKSYSYFAGLQFEKFVAEKADKLFVISEALKLYIIKNWNIDENKIYLLPNCVDIEKVKPNQNITIKPLSLAYAGSLIGYEGLDTLFHAIKKVRDNGIPVTLDIIGHGIMQKELETLSKNLSLDNAIVFHGKKNPEKAKELLSTCLLVCIPRKPFEVCKIIPPIKLVEAMALGKPVILPNLPVFRDEAPKNEKDESFVFFFESGNIEDLAHTIQKAFTEDNYQETLVKKGLACRDYVVQNRQWKHFTHEITKSKI